MPINKSSLIEVIFYKTKDRTFDFQFAFEERADGERIYILIQPSYRGRDDDAYSTHRLEDSWGKQYICWDSTISSRKDAKTVAAVWAEGTLKYIQTGRWEQ